MNFWSSGRETPKLSDATTWQVSWHLRKAPRCNLGWRMQWRPSPRRGKRLPRRGKGQICPINRFEGPAVYGCYFLSSLSRFASICVPEVPRSPGNIPKSRSKSRDPEDPEKCGSRAEALPARSSIFVEIFQICWGLLLLQVVVLSDHLLIKWVYTTFHKHDNNTSMVWVY